MPIARVQLADGRIARFDVPEGTTEAQINELVNQIPQQQQADRLTERRAGRGSGASKVVEARAQALEAVRQKNPILADEIANMSGPEAFLIGAGQGLTNVGQGVQALFGGEAQQTPEAIQQLQSVRPSAQVGEVVGEAAPFLVPGLGVGNIAGQTGRVAASAALGGAEGGLIAAGRGGDSTDVATGAAAGVLIGGAGEALLPVLNSVGRTLGKKLGVKGATTAADSADTLRAVAADVDPQDLVIAARELEAGGDIAGNAERSAVFDRLGITPTEAQRTRDIDLFNTQQDAFRRTGRVRDALDLQESQLTERTAEAVSRIGSTGAPSSVIDSVTERSLRLDDEINQLYKVSRERAGTNAVIRPSGAVESLKGNAPIDQLSNGTVQALRDQMAVMGVANPKGFKVSGKIAVNQSEELRQFANSLFDGANPQGRKVIRDFKQGLDDDVFTVAGEDVFKAARQAKTTFERGLTKSAKNKFDRNKTSLVRDILENKVAVEDVPKLLNAGGKYKAADLEDLKRYLMEGTPEDVARGQASWNDLRSSAMERIKNDAFVGADRADGIRSLSRAKLDSVLKGMGGDKIRVLFSRQEREFLKNLADISSLREPPPGTFTGSGPSSPAIDKLTRAVSRFSAVPGADLAADIAVRSKDMVMSSANERKVLRLVNDAEIIQKQNAKRAFEALRKSQLGEAAGAVPFTIIPVAQGEEQ